MSILNKEFWKKNIFLIMIALSLAGGYGYFIYTLGQLKNVTNEIMKININENSTGLASSTVNFFDIKIFSDPKFMLLENNFTKFDTIKKGKADIFK